VVKTLKDGAILILMTTAASLAVAATPATGASDATPDGYSAKANLIGKKRTDAKAQENERMGKCKAMKGDEKKGCEAYAKSMAEHAAKSDTPDSNPPMSKK